MSIVGHMTVVARGLFLFATAIGVAPIAPIAASSAAQSHSGGQPSTPRGFALSTRPPSAWRQRVDAAAFALREGETLHPTLPMRGLAVEFVGDVACDAAGDYTFSVEFEGGSASLVGIDAAGVAHRAEARDAAAGEQVVLETKVRVDRPGSVRLAITFARRGEERARLQASWQLSNAGLAGFAREPLPSRVVTPPREAIAACADEELSAEGRRQMGALGCAQCHDAAGASSALVARGKLDLTQVAARADEAWLERWITAPAALKPHAAMPALLANATASAPDLVAFLKSSAFGAAAPGFASTSVDADRVRRGRELYHSVGCVGCHGPLDVPAVGLDSPVAPPAPLGDLKGKWRMAPLAAFLRDPSAVRGASTMPSLGLEDDEADSLAHYLVEQFGAAPERPAAPLGAEAVARGKKSYEVLGCARCHALTPAAAADVTIGARPLASLDLSRGCLAEAASSQGRAPRYTLTSDVRTALRSGLASLRAITAAGASPAPLERARDHFALNHCGACHELAGRGGVGEWNGYFRSRVEADLGDEGRLPPRLDGVGWKLQSAWLARVIGEGARARPYLATRMPHFSNEVEDALVGGLAALDGEWRTDDVGVIADGLVTAGGPPAEQRAQDGRKLAGSGGLNCITCHSFGDRPSAGTPGLDFTQFGKRLRREWWTTYALAPARFKPGTRMPRYFEAGKSEVALLDGDAARQCDALWHWFERAATMPAPEGVPTGDRRLLTVGDRPVIFRTFLARAGNRGIAVGTPSGLHFAFDAEQVRLCEAWSGDFLDVAPVWEGRGGGVAGQLGQVVWSAPPGPLLTLEPLSGWPTDSGRAHGLKFLGYRIEPDGTPVFQWELREPGVPADAPPRADAVKVEEQFLPDPRADVLFVRKVTITGARDDQPIWLQPLGERARLTLSGGVTVRVPSREFQSEISSGVDPRLGCEESISLTASAGRPIKLFIEIR